MIRKLVYWLSFFYQLIMKLAVQWFLNIWNVFWDCVRWSVLLFSMILVGNGNAVLQTFSMMAFHVLSSSFISTLCVTCCLRFGFLGGSFSFRYKNNFFSGMKIRSVGRSGELAHYVLCQHLWLNNSEHFFLHREAKIHVALLLL